MNKIDSIMRSFTKTINKLEKLIYTNDIEMEIKNESITNLKRDLDDLAGESGRARNIIIKLNQIVN